jgi:flagellar hook assembly protein FlgD
LSGPPETGLGGARLGTVLLLVLLLLSLAGFTVTRAFRVRDDIVNTVVLSERIAPGESAEISFNTTLADGRADVLITDTEDRQVRALLLGAPLAAGRHDFSWDGIGDDGAPVPAADYGIRVILGEEGRDIKPPGRIAVEGRGG